MTHLSGDQIKITHHQSWLRFKTLYNLHYAICIFGNGIDDPNTERVANYIYYYLLAKTAPCTFSFIEEKYPEPFMSHTLSAKKDRKGFYLNINPSGYCYDRKYYSDIMKKCGGNTNLALRKKINDAYKVTCIDFRDIPIGYDGCSIEHNYVTNAIPVDHIKDAFNAFGQTFIKGDFLKAFNNTALMYEDKIINSVGYIFPEIHIMTDDRIIASLSITNLPSINSDKDHSKICIKEAMIKDSKLITQTRVVNRDCMPQYVGFRINIKPVDGSTYNPKIEKHIRDESARVVEHLKGAATRRKLLAARGQTQQLHVQRNG